MNEELTKYCDDVRTGKIPFSSLDEVIKHIEKLAGFPVIKFYLNLNTHVLEAEFFIPDQQHVEAPEFREYLEKNKEMSNEQN